MKAVAATLSELPVSAKCILWQGQGSLSLFESCKDLFQDRSELFRVGFHGSCGGEFFPSFLESLRTITMHSDLLRKGSCFLIVQQFYSPQTQKVFSALKIARHDKCLDRHEARDDGGVLSA